MNQEKRKQRQKSRPMGSHQLYPIPGFPYTSSMGKTLCSVLQGKRAINRTQCLPSSNLLRKGKNKGDRAQNHVIVHSVASTTSLRNHFQNLLY